jgi:uncharacterized SAM-binding protein YcdF (DUF218 family)
MTLLAAPLFEGAPSQRGGIIMKLIFLIFLALFLCVLYIARHPLLRFAGHYWVVDDTPEVSDVIIVLSGDNFDADRATRAASLYKAQMAPHVLATGRALRTYASSTDLMKRDLADKGVSAAAIESFTHDEDDTKDEALALSDTVKKHGWKKVLLVTSNYHTRRAQYIYERTLPPNTVLRVISAADSQYDPDTWWRTRRGVKLFFHEATGMAVAAWELRHNDVQTR